MTALVVPTRERLLAAARELVEEQGYAGASVIAVAERAGLAAGTLYRHFSSKEDLFVELFRAVCDREIEAMRAAAAQPLSPGERLVRVLVTFAERALRRPQLAWALLAEPVAPGVDAERLIYRTRYRELLAVTLRDAIAAGEVPEQDVELTSAVLVGGCAEALVGPLASGTDDGEATIAALETVVRRAVGA